MKVTVFGAAGRTGRRIVEEALRRGHEVTAFVRDRSGAPFDGSVSVVEGDAYAGENVEAAVDGADAVLSAIGHSNRSPSDLLTVAGENVLDAMAAAGVDRYVTLVGAAVRTDGDRVTLGDRAMGWLLEQARPDVLEDAKAHVDHVRARECDWTVVRAPRLTDAEATRAYRTGDVKLGFARVPRGDVASFMLDCAERGVYVRALPKIVT